MRQIPPDAQLSPQRLEKITDYFNAEVSGGKIPGAVVLIQRHGQPVYFQSFGKIDSQAGEAMTPDAIFRIFSMSKPITSVAALMLVDDGKMALDDSLSKFIPAFETVKVGVETKAANGEPALDLVPVVRPITIRDLLRHSSGMVYGFYGTGLVRKSYGYAGLLDQGMDNALLAEKVANLPLAEQPGTVWDYGHSTDVLGRVIEVVSGQSLYDFEKQRLFDPLRMPDTSYYVADSNKHHLIAEFLPSDLDSHSGGDRNPRLFSKLQSGGGGLVSTIGDYSRFCQMILGGGTFEGRRYLQPATFAAMTSNQIAPATDVKRGEYYFPGDGFGFGLGFGIRTEPGNAIPPPPGSLGELKWDGAGGSYFWIDPAQDMFAILLMMTPSERGRIHPAFKKLVYDAFEP
jgi:CubicO group peptidase (beta-lactamase class C family)